MLQQTFLKNLKVVELASVLAGPAVGQFFAELGAEVIKIENKKTGGDVTRHWKLPNESGKAATSAYYASVNWHKKALLLDLTTERDRKKVYQLLDEADIVISNFKLASAKKLGVDAAVLQKRNPKLIYAQLTAFGENDPKPAFDVVLQAEAGFLYMTGEPDREPVKMPVALIDLMAAHQLKEAILLALLRREKEGVGSYISVSLLESAIASLANQATNWLMAGHIPQRMGCQHPNIAPYGDIFYTLDNKAIVLAVGTERQFLGLCESLGVPEMAHEEPFYTNAQRVKNRVFLKDRLKPLFRKQERAVLLKKLYQNGVPVGSIRNMQEVFERPLAQQMILEEKGADGQLNRSVKTVAFELR